MKSSNTALCWECDEYQDAKTSEIRIWTDGHPHVICQSCRIETKVAAK